MTRYEIVIEGTAGSLLEAALDGLTVHAMGGGRSRIVGDVIDQAHLQALLHRLGDLHVSIVDVHRVE
jgi:hypothetical protein